MKDGYKMKLHIFLMVHYLSVQSVSDNGKCYKPGERNEYCCANYHDVYGICTECPIGTSSNAGMKCKVCEVGYYGKFCFTECKCIDDEICHNVLGCITNAETTTQDEGTSNRNNRGKEDSNLVKIDGIFYTGAAGLLVIGIFIGILLTAVKNKFCSRQIVSAKKDVKRQYQIEGSLEMNRYEYIDEEQMTDQTQGTVPPSLPVLRKNVQHQHHSASDSDYQDSIDGQHSIRKEDEGYLNPYQPIQEANIYQHEYKAISTEIAKSKQIDDYLHPYNSLLKHGMSESHEYKDLRNVTVKSELKSSKNNKGKGSVRS